MKHLPALLLMAILAACSDTQTTADNTPSAIEHGRADAEAAIATRPGTMEREKAILNIRATEYRIRQTGDHKAADAYLTAARELLDSANILN